MKILACYNIKGGVGKTAAAVNLAYLAAAGGARTLLWDLDPQGAASFYFRIKARVKGGGWRLLKKKHSLDDLIKGTDYANLDLLPADFSYRNLDLMLDSAKKPTRGLRKRSKALAKDYDYVFFDCPPSISLLSENVFAAADALLVPTIPTVLSLRTLDQLSEFLRASDYDELSMLPFFSMVDRRKRLHRELVESLPAEASELLKAAIPNSSDVERMGVERRPVITFAERGPAAVAYQQLWQEIEQRLRVNESAISTA